jgi:DNA-binding NarL/FixJ family response regulator
MQESTAKEVKPRILVVDDHPIVRHGLVQLLRHSREFQVCGQAGEAEEVLPLLGELQPDLLLLDLILSGRVVTDLIRECRKARPDLGILVISMQNEVFYAEQALKAGANGYIVKEEATRQILSGLRHILERKTYISYSIVKKMLYQFADEPADGKKDPVLKLSPREFQVFKLMGAGFATKNIAEELSVGVKTVEMYRARIKKKLHLENATELLRHAVRWSAP